MSWKETNFRQQILREVAAAIEADPFARLPWNDGYAEIFGDRHGLVNALRCRWNLMVEAQLDPDVPEATFDELRYNLMDQNGGVLRVLARYAEGAVAAPAGGIEEFEFEHAS